MTSPSAPIDAPGPVRDGEALDTAALGTYLRARGVVTSDAVHVEQFPRGFSNLTYLIVAGDDEFVLRRPPFGVGAGSAHDVLREFRILESLGPVYPFAPRVRLACEDTSVIGAPFYLMDRVRAGQRGLPQRSAQLKRWANSSRGCHAQAAFLQHRSVDARGSARSSVTSSAGVQWPQPSF